MATFDEIDVERLSSRSLKNLTTVERRAYRKFGQKLGLALDRKGLTGREVARRLGFGAANMTDFVNGDRIPSRSQLQQIHLILDDPGLVSELNEYFEFCTIPKRYIPVPEVLSERLARLQTLSKRGEIKYGYRAADYYLISLEGESLEDLHKFDLLALDFYILSHDYGAASHRIHLISLFEGIDTRYREFHVAYMRGRMLRCAGDNVGAVPELKKAMALVQRLQNDQVRYPWIGEPTVAMVERDLCFARLASKTTDDERAKEFANISLTLEARADVLRSEIRGKSKRSLRQGEIHYLDNVEALVRCATIAGKWEAVEDYLPEIIVKPFTSIRPRKERVGMIQAWLMRNSGDLELAGEQYSYVQECSVAYGNYYHHLKAELEIMNIQMELGKHGGRTSIYVPTRPPCSVGLRS